jgi:hypothetical protein
MKAEAGIVDPDETAIASQRLDKNVYAATDRDAMIAELL